MAESERAWDAGRRSDALRVLKEAVRRDPSDDLARRALAERYRELGNPDQAGRWGIGIDGWTTALERDRLARLLAASWVSPRTAAAFLALEDAPLPSAVTELFNGPVAAHREQLGARISARSGGFRVEQTGAERWSDAVLLLWGCWFFGSLIAMAAVSVVALSAGETTALARVLLLVSLGLLALAAAVNATSLLLGGSKRWGWVLAAVAVVVGAVALLLGVSGWPLG
ncbi:tetratricopeptide repeat protein [Plantibacter sp. Mn2098]|uniref:tetratricopeptide repeat protein n=1 Tax=Plantibacter sp. Mn2098 TaxID=3395266 RepID=UPI003BC03729